MLDRLEDHACGERDHGNRVAVYTVAMGFEAGIRGRHLKMLRVAATLHDIGKLSLPAEVLRWGEDRVKLMSHVLVSPYMRELCHWLGDGLDWIETHHERWDGEGYVQKLAGEAIPFEARLIGVAEAFDSLVNEVPWRAAVSTEEALRRLRESSGTQFDPRAVEMLERVQPKIQPVGRA